MSSGLNYGARRRASRCAAQLRANPGAEEGAPPTPQSIRGWRTEWPEEFPVTVRKISTEGERDEHAQSA